MHLTVCYLCAKDYYQSWRKFDEVMTKTILLVFWDTVYDYTHPPTYVHMLCVFLTFLPARRYASAGNSDRNVSVCPSVTRRYCVKTKKASDMISSPSGSTKTLVFRRQISSPNSKGFPPNGGLKQGSVGKIQLFSAFKLQYLENGSRYGQSYY